MDRHVTPTISGVVLIAHHVGSMQSWGCDPLIVSPWAKSLVRSPAGGAFSRANAAHNDPSTIAGSPGWLAAPTHVKLCLGRRPRVPPVTSVTLCARRSAVPHRSEGKAAIPRQLSLLLKHPHEARPKSMVAPIVQIGSESDNEHAGRDVGFMPGPAPTSPPRSLAPWSPGARLCHAGAPVA